MLFSLNYKSKYKQEADEVRCPLNQLGTILNFIKDNPNKRYNISIEGESLERVVDQIGCIKEIAPNYTLRCDRISMLQTLIKTNYNAYLKFPVCDWETFTNLKHNQATDIYIDGPLGFQVDAIKAGKASSKIRVSPTVSPNAALSTDSNINSFFIRPEDLSLYEGAIDIIDFNEPDQDREDTLFKIYKRGTFNFNLQNLVPSISVSIPNLFIKQDFAETRLNCRQKCKTPGRICNTCETYFKLTNRILDNLEKSN